MTNNEVDVAKCEQYMTDFKQPNNIEGGYYTHHNICECGTQGVENFNFFCKDNPNCYYKQLQRKTAECEKLKSALEEIEKFCYRGVGNCDGNEAECNISLILDLINKAKEQE